MAKRLKWGTLENLDNIISEYFEKEPMPTVVGLRVALDISKECFNWYVSDRWKYHRKTEEEIEEIKKKEEGREAEEAFEEWEEISPNLYLVEEFSQADSDQNYTIKEQVSVRLKKAKDKIEVFNMQAGYTAKNPAFAIFTAKSVFEYRETAPEQSNSNQLPSKITIQIMPAPDKPELQPSKVSINTSNI